MSPSAGIGRQDELKFRWYKIVNVQVVFRINIYIYLVKTLLITCIVKSNKTSILYKIINLGISFNYNVILFIVVI